MQPNITTKGRLARGGTAVLLAAGAVFLWRASRTASLALSAGATFVAVEALRGWCALRACGIRTPL